MPDVQEGDHSPIINGEPQEDHGDQRRTQEPFTHPGHGDDFDTTIPRAQQEASGEMADVVADSKQEPGEDSTAAEEETAKWEAGESSAKSTVRIRETTPEEQRILTTQHLTKNTETKQDSSDIPESSGETRDVVSDATQSGKDILAKSAEERSLDIEAARKHDKKHKPYDTEAV